MPRRMMQSASHAVRGLLHTFRAERNFRLFLSCFALVVVLAAALHIALWEWAALLLAGCGFMMTELLNTAIETLVDSVDDHYKRAHQANSYTALRMTKDTASAASLVMLILNVLITCGILLPRIVLLTS